jgi:predicted dehydrogenase
VTLSPSGERIPLIVVGLGRRGSQWVSVVRSSSRYDLVACVDTDLRTLREVGARLNVPADQCYTRLDEALDRTQARAAIVATPIDCHVEPCRVALERGVGVLVEKPFTLSLAEAQQLVAAAEQAKTGLVVGQNYRYTRMVQAVRRLLRDGVLGRIGTFVSQCYRGDGTGDQPWLSRVAHSALWEAAVHHLDALRYMRAERLVGVMAESFAVPWATTLPGASLHCLLAFEDGVRGAYTVTYGSVGHSFFEGGNQFLLRIVGERGTLHVWQRWIVLCERGRLPRLMRRGPRPVSEEVLLLQQLEQAILTGEEPESGGRDNLQTMALLEACARSAADARWVNPQELLRGAC